MKHAIKICFEKVRNNQLFDYNDLENLTVLRCFESGWNVTDNKFISIWFIIKYFKILFTILFMFIIL